MIITWCAHSQGGSMYSMFWKCCRRVLNLILALEWSQYSQHFVGGVTIKRFPHSLRILIYLEGILTSYSFRTEQEVIKNISP